MRVCLEAQIVIQRSRGFFIKELGLVLTALDGLFCVHSSSSDALFALDNAEGQAAHHHLFELFVAAQSASQTAVELILRLLLYCSLFQNEVIEVPSRVHDVVSK